MSVEFNIAAREAAEEAMEFCREVEQEARCVKGVEPNRFWEVLESLVGIQVSLLNPLSDVSKVVKKADTMSDAESKRFGNQLMPFGEFAGQRVDEVPLDRLEWYADQKFTDELRRYLKSKRIQVESSIAE